MSSLFINYNFLIILSILISITSLKIKINGRQKNYCFTKDIYEQEDTLKFFFLVSSGNPEMLDIILKDDKGKELYHESDKQVGEYQSDVLPSGAYTLCFSPRNTNEYYITFDLQITSDLLVIKDLAKDKEVKNIKIGVLDLERLFNDFEKNLKFIVDRRNHHHTILEGVVKNIKILSAIKIMVIIILSLFQIFIITKLFGSDKRMSTIKAGTKDML